MTRIEKIRRMTDEELAEFLSAVAGMNGNKDMLVDVNTVRDMTDAEFAGYMSDLDDSDHCRSARAHVRLTTSAARVRVPSVYWTGSGRRGR